MMKPVVYLQLRVGTVAGQPKHVHRYLTVNRIHNVVKRHFENFTRINSFGQWSKQKEAGALIDTVTIVDERSPEKIFTLCRKSHSAIEALLREMPQLSVLAMVRVSIEGRETSWMRLVSWDGGALTDPPFPFPSLLVRKLAPKADMALRLLYRILSARLAEIAPDSVKVFPGVPAFCFQAKQSMPLRLHIKGDFKHWDAQLLNFADTRTQVDDSVQAQCGRNSDYIGLFQKVSSEPVYFATDISKVLDSPPFSVTECSYYHGAGCCEAANLELLDLWLGQKFTETDMRKHLSEELNLSSLFQTPYPMIGMEVLTLTPDGCILRKRRSQDVCALPGAYSLVPSGMVEPVLGCTAPSVSFSVLRELDEEMFRRICGWGD